MVNNVEVHDYLIPNLYRVLIKYSSDVYKINDIDQEFGKGEYTINEEVKSVKKKTQRNITEYYKDAEGERMSIEEYNALKEKLHNERVWDEEQETYVYDTKETKELFNRIITFLPMYSPTVTEWVDVPFTVFKKQFVEEKYKDFIASDIILGYSTKSICTYNRNMTEMAKRELEQREYKQVHSTTYKDDPQKTYRLIGDTLFLTGGGTLKLQIDSSFVESYENCVKKYEDDLRTIKNVLDFHSLCVNNVKANKAQIKSIVEKLTSFSNELTVEKIRDRNFKNNALSLRVEINNYINDLKTIFINEEANY